MHMFPSLVTMAWHFLIPELFLYKYLLHFCVLQLPLDGTIQLLKRKLSENYLKETHYKVVFVYIIIV